MGASSYRARSRPHRPTEEAAFFLKMFASLMYRSMIALDLWRVCLMIRCSGTSAAAAEVANPARREWPENSAGSRPAAWATFFTTRATEVPVRASRARFPCLSIERKRGPDVIPEALIHEERFLTGQVSGWEP